MKDCHSCRFHLKGEKYPHTRCLIFYNQGIAIHMLRDGLIGKCKEYKPLEKEVDDMHTENNLIDERYEKAASDMARITELEAALAAKDAEIAELKARELTRIFHEEE